MNTDPTQDPAVAGPVELPVRALPEPLPCPFCGRQPELDNPDTLYPNGTGWKPFRGFRSYVGFSEVPKEQWCYGMHCCQCCGGCGAEIHGDSAAEAVQRWNRRPNGSVEPGTTVRRCDSARTRG